MRTIPEALIGFQKKPNPAAILFIATAVFLSGIPILKSANHCETRLADENLDFYIRLRTADAESCKPFELAKAVLYFGERDGGDDHMAVRITGTDCDLIAIYGMDFPQGRGPVGRSGTIQTVHREDVQGFFPNANFEENLDPWIRLGGKPISLKRGWLLIQSAEGGMAKGELELGASNGGKWFGEFVLPFEGKP